MGKLVKYLTILIFVDLLFVVTAQLVPGSSQVGQPSSLGSIIVDSILNVGSLTFGQLFTEAIGNISDLFASSTGIANLLAGSAVIIGTTIALKQESLLYIVIGFSLSFLTADFIYIFQYLLSLNSVLALLTMIPLATVYIITVLEWVRGKD